MAVGDFLFGKKPSVQQLQRFTPEQQSALDQILSQGLQQSQPGQAQQQFEPIAQRARSQFQQQTIPSIAERFSGVGGQGSSGFRQALGGAGADLEERLASLGAQFGQQQQQLGQNLLQQGLSPRFEFGIQPEQQGLLQGLAGPLAQGVGQGLGGGGLGALLGALGGANQQQGQQQQGGQQNILQAIMQALGGGR